MGQPCVNVHVQLPIEQAVLNYLYDVTKGRLRYIFGLLNKLFNQLQPGTMIDCITLPIAKPFITNNAKARIKQFNLSRNEESVLKVIVQHQSIQVKEIAEILKKRASYISNILAVLQSYKLVSYDKQWRNHYYHASIHANIAYADQP